MKVAEYPELKDMFTVEEILKNTKNTLKIIKPLVCDTGMLLDQYLREDKKSYLKELKELC